MFSSGGIIQKRFSSEFGVTEKIRVGFAGVAHFHADSYVQCFKMIPNVEVVGAFERNRELAIQFSDRFGTQLHESLQALLKDVDAVVVASENAFHFEYAAEAVENKKHVLCEKPMTIDLEQADKLVKLVEKNGVKFQMCYVMRYHTVTSLAKGLVDEGKIGKLLSIIGTNKLNRYLVLLRNWFTDKRLSGGGAVMDHTVHLSDLIRWYSGSEIEEVYTEIGRNVNENLSVEDNFLTTVRTQNRVIGHIDGSWTYSSGHYTWGDVTLELLGTDGVIYVDAFRQNINFIGNEKPSDRLSWHYYGCNADLSLVKDFIRCIVEDTQPLADVYDGRQGVAVTLASYESSRTGRAVKPK